MTPKEQAVDTLALANRLRSWAAAEKLYQQVEAENNVLRGLLGNSAKPCPYCGLAAEDQAKCAKGFPGCDRADDQQLSKHFADGYRADQAEAEIERLRKLCAIGLAMAETAAEYATEALAQHELALGRTTQRNRLRALRMEEDISSAKDAQPLFRAAIDAARKP